MWSGHKSFRHQTGSSKDRLEQGCFATSVWVPNVVTSKIKFWPNGPSALKLYNPTTIDLKNDRKWRGMVILLHPGATKIMSEKSDSMSTSQENVPEQKQNYDVRAPVTSGYFLDRLW